MRVLLIFAALALSACAIAPKEESMKEYAYIVEKSDGKGEVTYMDITHFRFKVQPKEYAMGLIGEHCPDGHKIIKERTEQKTQHFAYVAGQNNWKIIQYKCE